MYNYYEFMTLSDSINFHYFKGLDWVKGLVNNGLFIMNIE